MDATTLKKYAKATLRQMASSKGLTKFGYNGRTISRMRKQDFIDFLTETSNSNLFDNLGEEILEFLHALMLEDLPSHPIFNLMSIELTQPSSSSSSTTTKERTPEDVDENVPDLLFKEQTCSHCSDCDICEFNAKVKKNLDNVENKLTCVVCGVNFRNVLFVPCNHLATCINCSKNREIKTCPLCRKKFDNTIRVFD